MEKFNIVKEIVDYYDPFGLLDWGCPGFEYDSASTEISKAITVDSTADEIISVIFDVFSSTYGSTIDYQIITDLAKEIEVGMDMQYNSLAITKKQLSTSINN